MLGMVAFILYSQRLLQSVTEMSNVILKVTNSKLGKTRVKFVCTFLAILCAMRNYIFI